MNLNTNLTNSTASNQYKTQIKNNTDNTTSASKSTQNLNAEKVMQQMVFAAMLSQMMGGSQGSMMSEQLINSLTNQDTLNSNTLSSDDSLDSASNFNSFTRMTSQSLAKNSNSQSSMVPSQLGLRASKYESDLNPGAIGDDPGDYGGKSYGAWQFSSKTGSLKSFVDSLKNKDNNLYSKLMAAKNMDGNTYGKNFDAVWKQTASNSRDKFLSLQQDYIKQNFYDPTAQALKSKYGFDVNQKSAALKESLWSTAVQHGSGGAVAIFSKLNLNNSDGKIINDLYNERQKVNIYFRSSSSEIQQSVYNRFTREKQDMLSMLKEESS